MTTTLRPAPPDEAGVHEHTLVANATRRGAYTICANGAPVGSILICRRDAWGTRQGWIEWVEVEQARRRRGHASVAVLTAEDVLRGWGCRKVATALPGASARSLRLFASLGYGVDTLRMVKRLAAVPPALPDGLSARAMTAAEYQEWAAREVPGYVESLMVGGDVPRVLAEVKAADDLGHMLPQGPDTPGVALRVLEHAGERVGTLLVGFDSPRHEPSRGWIYSVEVTPEHRGAGYGRALMLLAERECRAQRIGEIGLNVFGFNQVAIALYESLGYGVEARWMSKTLP